MSPLEALPLCDDVTESDECGAQLVTVEWSTTRTGPPEDMMRLTEDQICSGTVTCTVGTEADGVERKETPEETPSLLDHLPLIHIDFDGDESRLRSQEDHTCCSRNVMRKQRHWEKIVAAKKSKRRQEKETRKAKQCDAGAGADRQQHSKKFLKALTKERLLAAKVSGSRLCIDLSMTDHMSKKEISRLAAQIRRLYGSNKKATQPFWLYLTGFVEDGPLHDECVRMNDGFDRYLCSIFYVATVKPEAGPKPCKLECHQEKALFFETRFYRKILDEAVLQQTLRILKLNKK
ncbi:hypothetical protein GDO78_006802 [Eleutherodactylus coqui]|uniref:tRNA (guanine(9)-N(1))-methyltransferase n=1 Tax=Eleutherodactylus coqui TaxID=57060 RepID=A0A8J6KBA2_ELECQ|nr:hypothetical protein GDO78_006802 [Eleutherodactylus coqui]